MRFHVSTITLVSCLLMLWGCVSDDTPKATNNGVSNNGITPTNNGTSQSNNGMVANNGTTPVNNGSNNGNNTTNNAIGDVDLLLESLRSDLTAGMQTQSDDTGWPAAVAGGFLFVSTNPALNKLAGTHDEWAGADMTVEQDFAWLVVDVPAGTRYKFTDLTDWVADPWSRAYEWDENGIMSMTTPTEAHLERRLNAGFDEVPERTLRFWVPGEDVTHVLLAMDGQNLFNPNAISGGWRLQHVAPPGMLIVGVDNIGTGRMMEYTHVADDVGQGIIGGGADEFSAFILRQPLRIALQYGDSPKVGVIGSSLGGLVSLHLADSTSQFDFVASLSGTLGWGSISQNNLTMIERYAAAGHRDLKVYIDSGGNGTCVDSDADGIEDDAPDGRDSYCENKQMERVLLEAGYTAGTDLWHWHEPNALHNETAWAARVFRPLEIFSGL